MLEDETVCISIDGWSNVHNEPIVYATVTTSESEIFFVNTVDTISVLMLLIYLKMQSIQ